MVGLSGQSPCGAAVEAQRGLFTVGQADAGIMTQSIGEPSLMLVLRDLRSLV
jgi:hypothetical protein